MVVFPIWPRETNGSPGYLDEISNHGVRRYASPHLLTHLSVEEVTTCPYSDLTEAGLSAADDEEEEEEATAATAATTAAMADRKRMKIEAVAIVAVFVDSLRLSVQGGRRNVFTSHIAKAPGIKEFFY